MNLTWFYFCGSAVLATGLLLNAGAPLPAVLVGIGGAALFMLRKSRAKSNT
jgi:hypothetical protein